MKPLPDYDPETDLDSGEDRASAGESTIPKPWKVGLWVLFVIGVVLLALKL